MRGGKDDRNVGMRRTPTGVLLTAVEGNPAAIPDGREEHLERIRRHDVKTRARRRLLALPAAHPFPWRAARISVSPFSSMIQAQDAEWRWLNRASVSPVHVNALKAMGRIARTDGSYQLSPRYQF